MTLGSSQEVNKPLLLSSCYLGKAETHRLHPSRGSILLTTQPMLDLVCRAGTPPPKASGGLRKSLN